MLRIIAASMLLATAKATLICIPNSLCDDSGLVNCAQGMVCAEKDAMIGLGKCCADDSVAASTLSPPMFNFPTTTRYIGGGIITNNPFLPFTTRNPFSPIIPQTGCVDKISPVTGQSECAAKILLCQDSLYYDLMTMECPRTCGRCGVFGSTTRNPFGTTRFGTGQGCQDKVNVRTGASDCPRLTRLCNDPQYR